MSDDEFKSTDNQQSILEAIALGRSDKEIALALNLSHRTVGAYVSDLCKRHNARNRASLVFKAVQRGSLEVDTNRFHYKDHIHSG